MNSFNIEVDNEQPWISNGDPEDTAFRARVSLGDHEGYGWGPDRDVAVANAAIEFFRMVTAGE